MVKGILADANIQGHVDYLVSASDADIWQRCQDEGYVMITDNRNQEGLQSLEATIRSKATEQSLPVLTIGNVQRLQHDGEYAQAVVTRLLGILIEIDAVRGAGRLYLP